MPRLHSHFRYSDQEYIQAIRAGGPGAESAIAAIYQKYRRSMMVELTKLIRRHPVFKGYAEDLMHDAFLLMLHKIESGSLADIRSLFGLWIRIAKNLFLNELKKDERMTILQEPENGYGISADHPEQRILSLEEKERLESIFRQLGSRCRDILLLWASRYSMAEIAFHLHLSGEAMARKIKYTCFKKVKEMVRTGHKWPG